MPLKPATRQGVKPLIGLYGESGCGKTYSALLLARGLAGPLGRIAMIDSESGRGSIYADVIPGGYETTEITEPFSPSNYIAHIREVEAAGVAVGIIDSASHEWEGLFGVLDMAADIENKSGKPGLHCWRQPKAEHAKFMLKMLQSPIPWIVCLRAKYKSRQGKDERGKTVIIKDDHTTPIQADDFIYEMTAHGEIMHDHSLRLTKWSHPSLKACFPEKGPITIEHGKLLAQWCAAAGAPEKQQSTAPETDESKLKRLKGELWALLKAVRGPEKDWVIAEGWLWNNGLLASGTLVKGLSIAEMEALISVIQKRPK